MSKYRYFEDWELGCRCPKCRDNPTADNMDPKFMEVLIGMRERLGFAFPISSGYRCPEHPVEKGKASPGAHTTGKAVDITVSGVRAYKLLREAMEVGILGIGVNQKGGSRYLHLDMWAEGPRPSIWSY